MSQMLPLYWELGHPSLKMPSASPSAERGGMHHGKERALTQNTFAVFIAAPAAWEAYWAVVTEEREGSSRIKLAHVI